MAHRISLVAMHSGALAFRDGLSPEEVSEAAAVIRDHAHLALSDLRDVLGVLRELDQGPETTDTEDGEHRPRPTLAGLDSLVALERRRGETSRSRATSRTRSRRSCRAAPTGSSRRG